MLAAPPARCGRARGPAAPGTVGDGAGAVLDDSALELPAPARRASLDEGGHVGEPRAPGTGRRRARSSLAAARSVPSSSRIWVTASRDDVSTDAERRSRGLGSRSSTRRAAGRLDADDRHVVGDDVVQLAGDAQPLLDDGLAAQARGLRVDGARLLGEPVALQGRCARRPGPR